MKSRLMKRDWPLTLASLEPRRRNRRRTALVHPPRSGVAHELRHDHVEAGEGAAGVGDDDVAAVDEVLRHERAHARAA